MLLLGEELGLFDGLILAEGLLEGLTLGDTLELGDELGDFEGLILAEGDSEGLMLGEELGEKLGDIDWL